MKNISGNASTWLKEDKKDIKSSNNENINNPTDGKIVDIINPLIHELSDLKNQLSTIYCKYPKKELSDALVNIQLSLISLTQLN